jgi:hypothetical protein
MPRDLHYKNLDIALELFGEEVEVPTPVPSMEVPTPVISMEVPTPVPMEVPVAGCAEYIIEVSDKQMTTIIVLSENMYNLIVSSNELMYMYVMSFQT